MELINNRKPLIFKLSLLLLVGGIVFFSATTINSFKSEWIFSERTAENKPNIPAAAAPTLPFQAESVAKKSDSLKTDFRDLTYDEKLAIEKELNQLAAKRHNLRILSGATIYQMLLDRGAEIDPDVKHRLLGEALTEKDWEYIQSYMAQLATEEENFKIEIASSMSFLELKKKIDARTKKTGLFYGDAMLSQSTAYREASANDILSVLHDGATLPANALEHMIIQDNIDLAVSLSREGVNVNAGYIDEFRGMNVFELHAEKLAINPFSVSIDVNLQDLDKLASLGAPIKVNDGTRDALDIVLFAATKITTTEAASKLLQYAVKVNQMGISLERSHMALLNELQKTHPDLYQQYAGDLK